MTFHHWLLTLLHCFNILFKEDWIFDYWLLLPALLLGALQFIEQVFQTRYDRFAA